MELIKVVHVLFLIVSCAMNPVLSLAATSKRVALITGANKGIGKEIARKLSSEENIICILACRDKQLGTACAKELTEESGCNVEVVQLDLIDTKSIDAAEKFVREQFGRLDILVNNAAICFNDPTLYGKVQHTPFEQQADITIQTNFFGTLYVTQKMLSLLQASPSPRIINIASSAGRLSILPSPERMQSFSSPDLQIEELEGYMRDFVANVEDGTHLEKGWPNTCYGVSKVGIIAMTKILARDEPSIMTNSVDPGYCATDQNNNQGFIPAERGAFTPFLLATLPDDQFLSGKHWYEEREIAW